MRWWPFRKHRTPFEYLPLEPLPPIFNVKVHTYVGEPPSPQVWMTCTRPAGWHFGEFGPAEYDMEIALEVGKCG